MAPSRERDILSHIGTRLQSADVRIRNKCCAAGPLQIRKGPVPFRNCVPAKTWVMTGDTTGPALSAKLSRTGAKFFEARLALGARLAFPAPADTFKFSR